MNPQNNNTLGLKSISNKFDDLNKLLNDLKNQINDLQQSFTVLKANQEQHLNTINEYKKNIDNLNNTLNNIMNS